jgi:hypothetical protein
VTWILRGADMAELKDMSDEAIAALDRTDHTNIAF